MANSSLENIILENPGMGARQISRLSGIGVSQVIKVKRKLKQADPEKFGLQKKYTINEDSLNEVAGQVLGGMTEKEKRGYIRAIIKKLLGEKRISLEDVEDMMGSYANL